MTGSASSTSQSSALQQRINEKRAELDNLKQLRDLSAGLAGQMEQLEDKISTLSNGTEGIAFVFTTSGLTLYVYADATWLQPSPPSCLIGILS